MTSHTVNKDSWMWLLLPPGGRLLQSALIVHANLHESRAEAHSSEGGAGSSGEAAAVIEAICFHLALIFFCLPTVFSTCAKDQAFNISRGATKVQVRP